MSVIVTIMDRAGFAANTDIMVVVDAEARRLLWIPRDLWCEETLGDRINTAYQKGGHALLIAALREHGLEVDASLCLSRAASEAALEHLTVLMPVPVRMVFAYPLAPTKPIEDGAKQIEFNPPAEMLRGERIHQWVGARGASDLHRIERQKVFVRRLLEQRFDFRSALSNPDRYQLSDLSALDELAHVKPDWAFETFSDLIDQLIDGKVVFVTRAQYPIGIYGTAGNAEDRKQRLRYLAELLSLEDNPHYQHNRDYGPASHLSYCSIFVADMVNNLFDEQGTVYSFKHNGLPGHHLGQLRYSGLLVDGYTLPPISSEGEWLSASKMTDWLKGRFLMNGADAASRGWSPVNKEQAIQLANQGYPVAVCLETGTQNHLALLRSGCEPGQETGTLRVMQAGRVTGDNVSLEEGFRTTDVSFIAYQPVDYSPLKAAVRRYVLNNEPQIHATNIGYTFVDVTTGQCVNANGYMPQAALSLFKPQLAACYLWLVENDYIETRAEHEDYLRTMLSLEATSNMAATCVFQFVGGLTVFNDWLADQGFTANLNHVAQWSQPACNAYPPTFLPAQDDRYLSKETWLKRVFTHGRTDGAPDTLYQNLIQPVELAHFYARIYRGQILNPAHTQHWLDWMQGERDTSLLVDAVSHTDEVRVYAKTGWIAADDQGGRNIHHEAGIVETPEGAFVLGIYVRDYPEFPANAVIHNLASMTYTLYKDIHR